MLVVTVSLACLDLTLLAITISRQDPNMASINITQHAFQLKDRMCWVKKTLLTLAGPAKKMDFWIK